MITNLLDGLAILQTYDADAPVVTQAYMITIPKILQSAMSGPDQTAIELLGWVLHPVYLSYYYPVETITELATVTGTSGNETPVFPIPLAPPPIP